MPAAPLTTPSFCQVSFVVDELLHMGWSKRGGGGGGGGGGVGSNNDQLTCMLHYLLRRSPALAHPLDATLKQLLLHTDLMLRCKIFLILRCKNFSCTCKRTWFYIARTSLALAQRLDSTLYEQFHVQTMCRSQVVDPARKFSKKRACPGNHVG